MGAEGERVYCPDCGNAGRIRAAASGQPGIDPAICWRCQFGVDGPGVAVAVPAVPGTTSRFVGLYDSPVAEFGPGEPTPSQMARWRASRGVA